MSTSTACFDDIIGLSRKACDCVEVAPADANESASGIFLDELEGLNLRVLDAGHDCGDGGLWAMMASARASAIDDLKADLLACIKQNASLRRNPVRSQIGQTKKASANVYLRKPYHGMTVRMAHIVGGQARLLRIAACMRFSGTVIVTIYDSTQAIAVYELQCTAGQVVWNTLPTPLELSMETEESANPQYWLLFEPPSTSSLAMNTRIHCNCGGYAPKWSDLDPTYESAVKVDGFAWAQWVMAAGTYGTDLSAREDWTVHDIPTQGLVLDMDFNCDTELTLCNGTPNFVGDPYQRTMAHAVRFKAGAYMAQALLMSPRISALTMTKGAQLEKLLKQYTGAYQSRVLEYLCPEFVKIENINMNSDCFTCQDERAMGVSTIFT